MPLGPDHLGKSALQQGVKLLRVERTLGAIDEGADAIFLSLRHMVREAEQLLVPERMLLRFLLVEELRVEDVR